MKLNKIIEGWDTVVAQSNATRDFTRKAVIEAAQILDFSFARKLVATFDVSLSRLATMRGASKPGRTRNGAMRKTFSIPRIYL